MSDGVAGSQAPAPDRDVDDNIDNTLTIVNLVTQKISDAVTSLTSMTDQEGVILRYIFATLCVLMLAVAVCWVMTRQTVKRLNATTETEYVPASPTLSTQTPAPMSDLKKRK